MSTALSLRAGRRWAAAPVLALAAAGMAGCQGTPLPVGYQSGPQPPRTVELVNTAFIPHVINISVGQSVTWLWEDTLTPENVYLPDLGVSSPTYRRNNRWTYTFDQAGTFNYVSSLDPTMTGMIVVS